MMMEITQPEERGETYVARELERGHGQDIYCTVVGNFSGMENFINPRHMHSEGYNTWSVLCVCVCLLEHLEQLHVQREILTASV